jgi:SNARE protein 1
MGLNPAEVRLRRLLASTNPKQGGNPMKLLHNVAAMREQLAVLSGDSGHDDLPLISKEKAQDYAKQIDELAESIEASAPPLDIWEGLRRREDTGNDSARALAGSEGLAGLENVKVDEEESFLAAEALSPTFRRRRFQREQKAVEGKEQQGVVKVDSATTQLVDKHRQIQDALIGEMAIVSEQMKNNSLMMEKSLKDTERVLDSTEEAVEHSLSATNRANVRAGFIYKSSWWTGCWTWLILFLMILIFILMIGLIRFT